MKHMTGVVVCVSQSEKQFWQRGDWAPQVLDPDTRIGGVGEKEIE